MKKRVLTVLEVIDLVERLSIPVLQIERDLKIPKSVLARAMRPDTDKPLPSKYELALLDYAKLKKATKVEVEKKTISLMVEAGLEVPEKETTLSEEEKTNKLFWVEAIRDAKNVSPSQMRSVITLP